MWEFGGKREVVLWISRQLLFDGRNLFDGSGNEAPLRKLTTIPGSYQRLRVSVDDTGEMEEVVPKSLQFVSQLLRNVTGVVWELV